MSALIDLTGNKYGKLTVIGRQQNGPRGVTVWKCKCDCGNTTNVRGNNLKSGAVKSCGCLVAETLKQRAKHNMSKTRLYSTWASMKARCLYTSQPAYKSYGARGIAVCKEWKESFSSFAEWALSHGYTDDLTIERIDVNKGYSPDNCKWIPLGDQANNRRSNILITYQNETLNLSQWCNRFGKDYCRVHNRMYKNGWSFERAMFEPVHVEKRNRKE